MGVALPGSGLEILRQYSFLSSSIYFKIDWILERTSACFTAAN